MRKYGEANERNESSYEIAVMKLMNQVEIYDQVFYARSGGSASGKVRHSKEGTELVSEILSRLREIPDGCTETFPFELIEELEQEYKL